jgi:hypothetical protein
MISSGKSQEPGEKEGYWHSTAVEGRKVLRI